MRGAQLANRRFGIEIQAYHVHIPARQLVNPAPAHKAQLRKLIHFVQHDIFGNTAFRNQIDLLIDDADAVVDRIVVIAQPKALAIQKHFALIGMIYAAHDFHQRGFARAILAEDGVNLALVKLHGYILQRLHAAERFGNVFKLQHILPPI